MTVHASFAVPLTPRALSQRVFATMVWPDDSWQVMQRAFIASASSLLVNDRAGTLTLISPAASYIRDRVLVYRRRDDGVLTRWAARASFHAALVTVLGDSIAHYQVRFIETP